ncbi:MAG: phenylalanine--tRNA ligase beta subunit-related protein, partial [Candidatus Dojkabacteria bacterium]|nr:phenylalanine--tRNA ligase beta subunit-related protein [Candidatus Dojkabacteria bacterium]
PNIKTGDIVPVALPGAKVKTPEGTSKIKETDIHGVKSQGMLCSPYELGVGEDHSGIFILPDSLGFHTGRPLRTVRAVLFSKEASLADIPTEWAVFPGITVRRARSKMLEKWIKDQVARIKESPDASSWKGFRGLHEKFTGSPLPGSAEAIVTFIKETGTVPNINTFVDLYNVFSALTGISMGAHDIDKLDGQPRLTILTNDTPFRHATTNDQDLAKKGEYAYVDDRGILCRLDIKQSNRTAVTKDTRNILLLLQGNEQLTQQDLEKGLSAFQKLVDTLIEK